MNRFRDAMNRALSQTVAAAQTNIPAGAVRDQLRGGPQGNLPPTGNTGSGYSAADHNHTASGDGGALTNDAHAGYSVYEEISAPSAPATDTLRLYAKDKATVTELFYKNSAGTERDLSSTGGGGSIDVTDGTTTVSPTTTLRFPSGTVTDNSGGEAEYIPAGGSGASTATGAAGSEPGGPATGDLYLPNNGFVIERYSGSLWVPWGPLFPMTAPPTGGWTWDNQEAATISTANGGLALAEYTPTSNLNVYYRSLPSAPYTITLALLITVTPTTGSGTENIAGVVWRDSGGKIVTVEFGHSNNASVLRVRKWNSSTSFSGSYYATTEMPLFGPLIWVRLKDDNTNRMVQLSADGVNFITLHSVGRTDFLTANGYGLFVRPIGDAAIVTALSLG